MKYEFRLLLLVATMVALPCLLLATFSLQTLWGQKVIIEQKIKESYSALASASRKQLMDSVQNKIKLVQEALKKYSVMDSPPASTLLHSPMKDSFFQSVYLLDNNFRIVYPEERPKNLAVGDVFMPMENFPVFENAYFWEFQKRDFIAAVTEYQKIVAELKEQKMESLGIALTAIARCNWKANRMDKALETYQYLTTLFRDRYEPSGLSFIVEAKSQIAEIYKLQKDTPACYNTLLDLLDCLIMNEYRLAKAQYVYYYKKVVKKLGEISQDQTLSPEERSVLTERYDKIQQDRKRILEQEKMVKIALQYIVPQLKLEAARKEFGYIPYHTGEEQQLAYYQKFTKDNVTGYVVYGINLSYCIQHLVIPVLRGQEDSNELRLMVVNEEGVPAFGDFATADEMARLSDSFYLVVSEPLTPVFPFWELAVYLKNFRSLEELSRFRSQIYLFGLITVILTLALGVYLTITTFIREVKTARRKSDFVSNVTHELKTPLTAIKMFVETLLMGRTEGEEEQRECLQVISAETERLSKLIDRILNFAKMEQKRRIFHFVPHNLPQLIQETVKDFQNQIPLDKPFSITVTTDSDLPDVPIDRDAIQEALTNLLSNAYKYNNKSERKIDVKVSACDRKFVCVSVKDNGIGIPRHEFKRIFHKFYRIEDTLTREIEGTGLGLSLVKTIVRAHKGKIKLQSKVGIGSEFTMVLPIFRKK